MFLILFYIGTRLSEPVRNLDIQYIILKDAILKLKISKSKMKNSGNNKVLIKYIRTIM